MLSTRYGNFQPFVNINSREDGRYGGIQAGVTTYSTPKDGGEEQYQTSYFEVGARADHIADPLLDLANVERTPLTVANPLKQDRARVSAAPIDTEVKAEAAPAAVIEAA